MVFILFSFTARVVDIPFARTDLLNRRVPGQCQVSLVQHALVYHFHLVRFVQIHRFVLAAEEQHDSTHFGVCGQNTR